MPTANQLKEDGLNLFRQDRLAEAAEKFHAAAQAYTAAGQPDMAAEMMNNLCVIRLAEQDWPAALQAVTGTPEVFRARGDTLREAQALSNLGAAHAGAENFDQAADYYQQAIELFTRLGERENRAACWKALSALQVKQDKKFQALASMQAGLSLSDNLSPREKTLKGLLDRAMKMVQGR